MSHESTVLKTGLCGWAKLAVICAVALIFPACSGQGETPIAAASVSSDLEVDREIHYEGFKISFGRAALYGADGVLEIDAVAQNVGDDVASFYGGDIVIEDGDIQVARGITTEQPNIQASGRARITLRFTALPDDFDLKRAVVVLGGGRHRQVRVPLGDEGQVVAGAPVAQEVPPPVVVGNITVTPETLEVRTDDPAQHVQAGAGEVFIVLTARAHNTSAEETYYAAGADLTLSLPDLTRQPADDLRARDSLRPTKAVELRAVFMVPEPYAGTYGLDIGALWGPNDAHAAGRTVLELA